MADPEPFDRYLRRCDEEAEAVRRPLQAAGLTGKVSKEELLARARGRGLIRRNASSPNLATPPDGI
jgi:hypothetical protein